MWWILGMLAGLFDATYNGGSGRSSAGGGGCGGCGCLLLLLVFVGYLGYGLLHMLLHPGSLSPDDVYGLKVWTFVIVGVVVVWLMSLAGKNDSGRGGR